MVQKNIIFMIILSLIGFNLNASKPSNLNLEAQKEALRTFWQTTRHNGFSPSATSNNIITHRNNGSKFSR